MKSVSYFVARSGDSGITMLLSWMLQAFVVKLADPIHTVTEGERPSRMIYLLCIRWSPALVDTENGQMIALTPADSSNLSDFMCAINGSRNDVSAVELDRQYQAGESMTAGPLYPVVSNTSEGYAVEGSPQSYRNYTSYVFVDPGLVPAQGSVAAGNISLAVHYNLFTAKGPVPEYGKTADINASIPPGASGWIPVAVRIS